MPLDVTAGDVIPFGGYATPEITLDGERCLIMREDALLAVVETG